MWFALNEMKQQTATLLRIEEILLRLEKLTEFQIRTQQGEVKQMAVIDDSITALQTDVTAQTTVLTSVQTFAAGIPAMIQTAVNSALAQGATPAQLQALTDLKTGLEANTAGFAAAIVAGTPAAA
jgi:hypothetical protein